MTVEEVAFDEQDYDNGAQGGEDDEPMMPPPKATPANGVVTVEDEAGHPVQLRLVRKLGGGASASIFKAYYVPPAPTSPVDRAASALMRLQLRRESVNSSGSVEPLGTQTHLAIADRDTMSVPNSEDAGEDEEEFEGDNKTKNMFRRSKNMFLKRSKLASHFRKPSKLDKTNGVSVHGGKFISSLEPIAIKKIDTAEFVGYEQEFENLLRREKTALVELSKYRYYVTEYFASYYYPDANEYWIAMEYCDGGSLYHLQDHLFSDSFVEQQLPKMNLQDIRNQISFARAKGIYTGDIEANQFAKGKSLNFNAIAAICAGMLCGLEVIHKAGFIHGDIKSGNIMLCYPGIVKICDFGLTSKVVGVAKPDYHALGTVDYMAPEQMLKSLALDANRPEAESYKYDHRIDIWALGVILLELLLGRTPLHRLKHYDEEEFSLYIANFTKYERAEAKGSALGYFFYLPMYIQDMLASSGGANDKKLLKDRVPALESNSKHMLEMLMRPEYFNAAPNPSKPVAKPKIQKLFTLNKCLDFAAQCLYVQYELRPNATQLQKHIFVKAAASQWKKLEPKYDTIKDLQKKRAGRKSMWKEFPMALTVREVFNILEMEKQYTKQETFSKPQI